MNNSKKRMEKLSSLTKEAQLEKTAEDAIKKADATGNSVSEEEARLKAHKIFEYLIDNLDVISDD
jgi:hypothetical protein